MKTFCGIVLVIIVISLFSYCKKSKINEPPPGNIDTTSVNPQVDPPLANTIGFFMDDWTNKNFSIPTVTSGGSIPVNANVTVTIDRSAVITKIPRSIAGNNSNIWMTQLVTEPGLLDHISTIHPHIIRFPGGSISDIFFWNAQPNIPPSDVPAQLVNANGTVSTAGYWYGKNTASWTLSVDNYYAMLQQTNNQGMITINYGYARYGTGPDPVSSAAHLAADWIRYDNGRTKFWEIGNENFGDWEAGYRINTANNRDGQPEYLSGQLYGQHFKIFVDSMKKAALEIGKTIYIGAVLSESAPQPWWTLTASQWNIGLLNVAGNTPDFFIVHNYYTNYLTNASAGEILNTPVPVTGTMMNYVKQSITNAGLIQKPVILGEWNIFSVGSKQQVSHINGLHAVMVLGESLKNKFGMTARWDLANGWDNGNDHGMFNIGDEPDGVPKWNPRPAFYHMYFFQKYLGDRLVTSTSTSTDIISYASSFTSGETAVTLVNKAPDPKSVEITFKNFKKGVNYYWYVLTGGTDNGEFSRKTFVNDVGPSVASGGPANYKTINPFASSTGGGVKVYVPARSVVFVIVDKK